MKPTGWDCHAHVFGPYSQYPLASSRSYTPPEAPVLSYLALLGRLGLGHGVLVHPSAYGDDFSLLLSTLQRHSNLRGVVVLRSETTADMRSLRDGGIRGARFSHRGGAAANFSGSASFQDLLALAPRLAEAGMHAELWTDCSVLPDIAPRLRELPIPVIIDHMGGFDADAGIHSDGFRCLLSLVDAGRAWVKLCAYRNVGVGRLERAKAFHESLANANPEVLVWGSDWPHLRVEPAPDAEELLAACRRWTPVHEMMDDILKVNPARLYG